MNVEMKYVKIWIPFVISSVLSALVSSAYWEPSYYSFFLYLFAFLSIFFAVRIIRHYGFFSRYTLLVFVCLMAALWYFFEFLLFMFFWQNGFPT
jgi:hypothetical protein